MHRFFLSLRNYFYILPIVFLLLSQGGCSLKGSNKVADLATMPQDLTAYILNTANAPVMNDVQQQEQTRALLTHHYGPWERSSAMTGVKDIYWAYYGFNPKKAWITSSRKWNDSTWEDVKENSNIQGYPSLSLHAIVVKNTALRAMPTEKYWFKNPVLAGEGYPFDYFQNSALWIGTPVFIAHVSQDGRWYLVHAPFASGWVKKDNLAEVDVSFKTEWRSFPLAAIVQDNVPLGSGLKAQTGTLLPVNSGKILVPAKKGGQAIIRTITLKEGQAVSVPLAATPFNIATVGNSMMGREYGWGGLDENRDCSALLRDLFAPFGLWLPRNSSAQSTRGTVHNLKGLTADAKEQRIFAAGVPFSSLIYLPGHIGLYLGEFKGKAALFHAMWGVRTKEAGGSGRVVVGKAAITSLRPGAELSNIATPASILDRVEKLTVLP